MNYGENLKLLRERNGISQRTLAEIINVSRPAYTQYENEYNTIPCIHLITLCDYFNVSLDYIFNFNSKIQYNNLKDNVDKLKAGIRLKGWRKENKITQEKLAEFLQTSRSVIADYERGRFLISTSFLYMICKKYKVSADYLLGRIDSPKYLK